MVQWARANILRAGPGRAYLYWADLHFSIVIGRAKELNVPVCNWKNSDPRAILRF